ncbi:hypothetical protein GBN32_01980 [Plesiomonas shigelloides]|nr:hypothetical protein GBN32_01980 [Plesiomonas shigelloides]
MDILVPSAPSPYSGVIDSYKVSFNFATPSSLYVEPLGGAASFQAALQESGGPRRSLFKFDLTPGETLGRISGASAIPMGSTNLYANGYMTYSNGQVMVCSDASDSTFPDAIDGTIAVHLYNPISPQAGITFNAATRWYRKSTSLNVSWSPSTIDITGKVGESGTASSDLTVAAQTGYYGPVDVRFEYASAPCPAEIVVRDSSGDVNASLSTPGGVRFKLDVPYNSPVSHRYDFTATASRATTGTCNLNATLTLP